MQALLTVRRGGLLDGLKRAGRFLRPPGARAAARRSIASVDNAKNSAVRASCATPATFLDKISRRGPYDSVELYMRHMKSMLDSRRPEMAIEVFYLALKRKIVPSPILHVLFAKALTMQDRCSEAHDYLRKLQVPNFLNLRCESLQVGEMLRSPCRVKLRSLLNMWIDKNHLNLAMNLVLNHLVNPSTLDYNLLLTGTGKYPEQAIVLYDHVMARGCAHPAFLSTLVQKYAHVLQGLLARRHLGAIEGQKHYRHRLTGLLCRQLRTIPLTIPLCCTLMKCWTRHGCYRLVIGLYRAMESDPALAARINVAILNMVLNAHALERDVDGAIELFEKVKKLPNISPNVCLYNTLLKCMSLSRCKLEWSWRTLEEMMSGGPESPIWPDNVTVSILLDHIGREGSTEELLAFFESVGRRFELAPSLNNMCTLIEVLAMKREYRRCFEYLISLFQPNSYILTAKECLLLALLGETLAPMSKNPWTRISALRKRVRAGHVPLTDAERDAWERLIRQWYDNYLSKERKYSLPPGA